jgi:molybdenum cofactor guanylyltransferase
MEPLTVLILAGGQSSRMGHDKAWLDLAGVPLVEHVARRLMPLAAEIVFSTNSPELFAGLIARLPAPARAVADVFEGAGPLAGLHAGLAAAGHDAVLTVATDMPFVDHRLVQVMVDACPAVDAVIPRVRGQGYAEPQPEPLHAVYRKRCLPVIEAALRAGRRRMVSFLAEVQVCYLDEDRLREVDPELWSFQNVNTPAEWDAAIARMQGDTGRR